MFAFLFYGLQGILIVYLFFSLRRRYHLKTPALYYLAGFLVLYYLANIWGHWIRREGEMDYRSFAVSCFYIFVYASLTVVVFGIFYSLFLDGIELFKFVFEKARKQPIDPERRAFFQKTMKVGFAGAVFGSSAIGMGQAAAGPSYKFVKIPSDHPEMKGLKIVQISDLHVGPMIGQNYVQNVVDMVNAQKPDLIVLTGDLVDGSPQQILKDMQPLAHLQSPLGVYGCIGNHELYSGLYDWLPQFENLNIKMLNNEHLVVDSQQRSFVLAGLTDPQVGEAIPEFVPDAAKAMRGAPSNLYKIVLAHQPKLCFAAAEAGFDLQLSGHTHAGQFFPFSLLVRFAHPYVEGLNRHDNKMWVYVNRATGFWGPPNRFAIPAEITVLEFI